MICFSSDFLILEDKGCEFSIRNESKKSFGNVIASTALQAYYDDGGMLEYYLENSVFKKKLTAVQINRVKYRVDLEIEQTYICNKKEEINNFCHYYNPPAPPPEQKTYNWFLITGLACCLGAIAVTSATIGIACCCCKKKDKERQPLLENV